MSVPGRQRPGAPPWCPSPPCGRRPLGLQRRGSVYPSLQVSLAVLSLSVLLPFGNAVRLTEFLDFCFSPQQGKPRGDEPALGTRNTLAPGAWLRAAHGTSAREPAACAPPPHPCPVRPCCDVCTHHVSFGLSLPWTCREGNPCLSALPREGGEAPDCLGHPLEDQSLENTYFRFCSQGAPPGTTRRGEPRRPARGRLALADVSGLRAGSGSRVTLQASPRAVNEA